MYHVDDCVFYDVKLPVLFFVQDKYYIQSHIQMNEYRDRVIMVSTYTRVFLGVNSDSLVVYLEYLLQPRATKNHGRHIDTCVKVLDMTGLKLSALNQLKVHIAIYKLLIYHLSEVSLLRVHTTRCFLS